MSSKKVLAVFGATGQQGGGLASHVLSDPELSSLFSVRALVRDVNSDKAKALTAKGATLAYADTAVPSSLVPALTGADFVFVITAPGYGPTAFEIELEMAKAMADAAVAAGVGYILFSTLPSVRTISKGKYTRVAAFDAKAAAEEYIRSLPVKAAFFCLGSFMENYATPVAFLKKVRPDGTVVLSRNESPETRFPLIAAVEDTGKFVAPVLLDPRKYEGKRFYLANEFMTWEEKVAVMSKVMGKKIVYEQVPEEEYRAILPPSMADIFIEAFWWFQDFGYFGPDTDGLVQWSKENARGELTTFEGYLRKNPLSW
jgi:uncharacterized protein YbjT (DUF2867 family)